jgi:hypothetical protein
VPPTKYRRGRFLTANGHARIHDYYAGFQHGANCATASGQRQYLTVPVMVTDPAPEQLPAVRQVPKEQCAPNGPAPGVPTATAPQAVPSLPATPQPVPTDTTLLPPARPLLAPPVVPPPAPEVKADVPAATPGHNGVVSPHAEPRLVVPPKPEPR